MILRKSPPNQYDQHPKGTECKVQASYHGDGYDIWVQTSEIESAPVWVLVDIVIKQDKSSLE